MHALPAPATDVVLTSLDHLDCVPEIDCTRGIFALPSPGTNVDLLIYEVRVHCHRQAEVLFEVQILVCKSSDC